MSWSTKAIVHRKYNISSRQSAKMFVIKIECESDGSGIDELLEDILGSELWQMVRGRWLYSAIIVPGTGGDAPSGTFNFDIQNAFDMSKISVTGHAVDENTENTGSDEFGRFAVIEDGDTLTIATLGDGNKLDLYLYAMQG